MRGTHHLRERSILRQLNISLTLNTPRSRLEIIEIFPHLRLTEIAIMAAAVAHAPGIPSGPAGQPDITYAPRYDNYAARVKRRQETEKLDKSLPAGFPAQLKSSLVWDGRDLASTYDWNYVLTNNDLAEIDSALRHFKGK